MAKKQYIKKRACVFSGWRVPILLLCIAALVLTALALWPEKKTDSFPELEVAGCRIGEEEYLQAMYQARNDVLSDHAAAGISLKDWSMETALGDPRRLTMERALEILSEYYAVSTLACERGYLADASYEAMKRDMEEINRKRQEALNTGGVVTGFVSFTTDDYISYRASGIRMQFCNDPDNPENQVIQEEIHRRYEADRDDLYRQPDSLELAFLEAEAADDALHKAFQTLREKALERGDLAAALEDSPELKIYYQEISVDPVSYSTYARSHSDILTYSGDLNTGELSQVVYLDGWLCLIQCRERVVHDYVPLEEVESIVIQSIRENRYDALVEARVEQMQIRGDLEQLYRFTAERLP